MTARFDEDGRYLGGALIERRLAHADPRAVEYVRLRWAECWPTLSAFDSYPPAAWSGAIRRWVAHELDRIEALLVRVDALCCEGEREAS